MTWGTVPVVSGLTRETLRTLAVLPDLPLLLLEKSMFLLDNLQYTYLFL